MRVTQAVVTMVALVADWEEVEMHWVRQEGVKGNWVGEVRVVERANQEEAAMVEGVRLAVVEGMGLKKATLGEEGTMVGETTQEVGGRVMEVATQEVVVKQVGEMKQTLQLAAVAEEEGLQAGPGKQIKLTKRVEVKGVGMMKQVGVMKRAEVMM